MAERFGSGLVGKVAVTTMVTGTEIVGALSMITAGTASVSETATAGGITTVNTTVINAI
jgi:hypothetical protein